MYAIEMRKKRHPGIVWRTIQCHLFGIIRVRITWPVPDLTNSPAPKSASFEFFTAPETRRVTSRLKMGRKLQNYRSGALNGRPRFQSVYHTCDILFALISNQFCRFFNFSTNCLNRAEGNCKPFKWKRKLK